MYTPASLAYHLHRRDYAGLLKQIYNYGVASTAYLTKCVLDNPQLLFEIIPKLPHGFFFVLSGQSLKNSKKSSHFPKDLTKLELRGMLYGPFAYLQRRWQLTTAGYKSVLEAIQKEA